MPIPSKSDDIDVLMQGKGHGNPREGLQRMMARHDGRASGTLSDPPGDDEQHSQRRLVDVMSMSLIVLLLLLCVVLAIVGVTVKGLLWLTLLAILIALITGAFHYRR